MPVWGDNLITIVFIAARFHEPIDDHQSIADFSEAGGLVEKRSFFDSGHPMFWVLLGDDGFEEVLHAADDVAQVDGLDDKGALP